MNEITLIFGKNPLKEALKAHRVLEAYLKEDFKDKEIINLLKKENIKIKYLSKGELDHLSKNAVHQGVLAKIKPYAYFDLKSSLEKIKNKKNPLILILDGINDPFNFGAILRSSDVFGVDFIIVSKHHQVPLNMSVAKSSAGAINFVPVVLVSNLAQCLSTLKEHGFWIVSSDGKGDLAYYEIKYDFPVALIMGSEGKGVSPLLIKNSDFVVNIPQFGHVNSLNVSAATSILLSGIVFSSMPSKERH